MVVYYADEKINEKYFSLHGDSFVIKECYDNVFYNLHKFEKDIKVFIGYVQIFNDSNLYTRHACYVLDDKILDLTLMKAREGFKSMVDCEYIPIKIMDIEEYFKMLEKEVKLKGTTGLQMTLQKKDFKLTKRLMCEEGKIVI